MTHPESAPGRFFNVLFISRVLAPAVLVMAVVLFVACGGGDDDADPTDAPSNTSGASVTTASGTCSENVVAEPIEGNLLLLVVSSDMAVGENRFQVGLIDQEEGVPLAGATLHAQFICFDTEEGTPAFEADLESVVLTKTYTHTHADGTIELHDAGETGAYITYANFDRPGNWGVVITGETADGEELEGAGLTFNVLEEKFGLAVGDPAPRSVQTIASDVEDIRDIDTSVEPNENMHNITIADAVTSGKPTVIGFATPAYCQTQICGPVKEIMDDLYGDYEGDVNFIHIEPYDVPKMRAGDCESIADCIVPTVDEWRLPNEPWLFVVDADGNISAAFDGIASLEEIEAALTETLGANADGSSNSSEGDDQATRAISIATRGLQGEGILTGDVIETSADAMTLGEAHSDLESWGAVLAEYPDYPPLDTPDWLVSVLGYGVEPGPPPLTGEDNPEQCEDMRVIVTASPLEYFTSFGHASEACSS